MTCSANTSNYTPERVNELLGEGVLFEGQQLAERRKSA